jgi:hypothetical protein
MTSFVSASKRKYRFAFQVYLQSGQYEIGQETVGARDTLIDDNVPNNSIEWYTLKGQHVLTGLLIREEEAAADKAAAEKAAAAARKKAEALAEAARDEKAGVLCGVWGLLWSSSGRWGRAYAAVCDSFCFCLSLCACA